MCEYVFKHDDVNRNSLKYGAKRSIVKVNVNMCD